METKFKSLAGVDRDGEPYQVSEPVAAEQRRSLERAGVVTQVGPKPRSIYDGVVMGPQMTWQQKAQLEARKVANGSFRVKLGVIEGTIYGGPYGLKPHHMYGIKMAEEIKADAVISIPTQDYNVPNMQRFVAGLFAALTLLEQGYPLYVGCMGGIGRTGLFFGGLTKVMMAYENRDRLHEVAITSAAIKAYVRQEYYAHAIERPIQEQFLDDLDVSSLVEWVEIQNDGGKRAGHRPWFRRLLGL